MSPNKKILLLTQETCNLQGRPRPYTNPYFTGILFGLVLLASFVIHSAAQGASGGIAPIGLGVSARLNNRVRFQVERRIAVSVSLRRMYDLARGLIVGFARLLARGCTSG